MQDYKKGAEEFYNINVARDLESLSGMSSSLLGTYHFRDHLKKILVDKKIKTIADCPCGDWNWMRAVKLDGVEYTGYDILPQIVESNQKRFPNYNFVLFDAVEEILPKSDLIICKDFLTHLYDPLIEKVIANFRKSKSRYLLATSYKDPKVTNMKENWGFKEVDLERFGLVTKDLYFDNKNRYHGLYRL